MGLWRGNIVYGRRVRREVTPTSPWPMFHHDVRHTGRSSVDTSGTTGNLKWRFQTGDAISFSSPAVDSRGTIYIGSTDHFLYAINPDGTLKWKFETGDEICSSPTIDNDGTIYIGSEDGYLYTIKPNGNLKWKYDTGYKPNCTSPTISSSGIIYYPSSKYLHAINRDGLQLWVYETYDSIWKTAPAIGQDGTIYIGDINWYGYLYAINSNGSLKWKHKTTSDGSQITSSPALYNGYVIFADRTNPQGRLRILRTSDGQEVCSVTVPYSAPNSDIDSSPAIGADGTIYVGGGLNAYYISAFNTSCGLLWKFHTGSTVYSSPAIGADGTIYVGSNDYYLYAINPDGTLKWKFKTGGGISSSPAIGADGTIYVGSKDGYLYAIQ